MVIVSAPKTAEGQGAGGSGGAEVIHFSFLS